MEKHRILVAVDGSLHSDKVVKTAIEYAKLFSATVLLVHCHKKFPSVRGEPHISDAIARTIQDAEKLIQPFVERLKEAQIDFDSRLMEEPAGAVISDIAAIQECDLVIMGSRGLTNLEGLLLGSVTNKVLQTTPCSVLVVK